MTKIETYRDESSCHTIWKLTISDYDLTRVPEKDLLKLKKYSSPESTFSMKILGLVLLAKICDKPTRWQWFWVKLGMLCGIIQVKT